MNMHLVYQNEIRWIYSTQPKSNRAWERTKALALQIFFQVFSSWLETIDLASWDQPWQSLSTHLKHCTHVVQQNWGENERARTFPFWKMSKPGFDLPSRTAPNWTIGSLQCSLLTDFEVSPAFDFINHWGGILLGADDARHILFYSQINSAPWVYYLIKLLTNFPHIL